MNKIAAAIALGSAVSALFGDQAVSNAFRVYVTVAAPAAPTVEAAEADRSASLKVKRDQARQLRRVVENELKERFGGSRANWPADRSAELYTLEQAEALADADYEYRKSDPRAAFEAAMDIADSFQDKEAAGRPARVTLVSSASGADLVVAVAASRSGKTFPTQRGPDRCYILFTLGAGGLMDGKQFAAVPADYRISKFGTRAWRVAGPLPQKPVFYFEAYNGGGNEFGCRSAAANAASAAVDKFIEDNGRVLSR
jgi:hypothetical protein